MLEVNFLPFPTLETERLVLRKVTNEDVHDLFEMRADPIVMQHIDRPLAKTLDDAQKLIDIIKELLEKNDGITWAITLKGNNKMIGTFGFWRILKEHYRTEIGYLLHKDYWGKGLMQEAMDKGIDYAFNTLKVHTIEANINPTNAASIKLAERKGFVREAYFKDIYYSNGKFIDTTIYTLHKNKTNA
jgi:ribosomal-protein-alanine N-acetyltransferase